MNVQNIKVVLLYNEDGQISHGDAQDLLAVQYTVTAAQHIHDALAGLGYSVQKVAVRDSLGDLENALQNYSRNDTFIFDNCDGFRGDNQAAVEVIRLIEAMGFKHTGAPADAIALCIDKGRAKRRLIECDIPTPRFQVFDAVPGGCELEFPLIVKPLVEDASMGIDLNSVVTNLPDLRARVDYVVAEYEQPAIVEEFIIGRELAVAMLGNQEIEILPIAEDDYSSIPNPLEQLLTYESKWKVDSPYYQIASRIPAALTRLDEQTIRAAAAASFRAMGLRDLGRVDIRFRDGIPFVIDINELPDLSPEGGFWHSAEAAGLTYPQTIERILRLALQREGWID